MLEDSDDDDKPSGGDGVVHGYVLEDDDDDKPSGGDGVVHGYVFEDSDADDKPSGRDGLVRGYVFEDSDDDDMEAVVEVVDHHPNNSAAIEAGVVIILQGYIYKVSRNLVSFPQIILQVEP